MSELKYGINLQEHPEATHVLKTVVDEEVRVRLENKREAHDILMEAITRRNNQ